MAIRLGINTAALNAQRRLTESTSELGKAFTRLASGLRINRAGDDAAGLAVSSLLNADARVYNQAVRNLNDGLSFLNIAEGAASELKSILFRLREISTQASNGTYSDPQRVALDVEVTELQEEYGRILDSATFNERPMFGENSELTLQLGYGTVESLSFTLGLEEFVGNGTFQAAFSHAVGNGPVKVRTVDINGDGNLDILGAIRGGSVIDVLLGNGNGTFRAAIHNISGNDTGSVFAADFNGDGKLDLVGTNEDSSVDVLLGNGNGTFLARTTYTAVGSGASSVVAADLNGDGKIDLITSVGEVLLGNGNGTFLARVTYQAGDGRWIEIADLNGDGKLDAAVMTFSDANTRILLGNGDGTFLAAPAYPSGTHQRHGVLADVNGDGKLDVVTASSTDSRVNVLLGNGNGTFRLRVSFDGGNSEQGVIAQDFDGDGLVDLMAVSSTDGQVSLLRGNGDGGFKAAVSIAAVTSANAIAAGDFNGDGIADLSISNYNDDRIHVLLGNGELQTQGLSRLTGVSVSTRANALAAQSTIDEFLVEVNKFTGGLGAFVSRIETAITAVSIRRENYLAAASQILDADIAEESARLVKGRILQQAGAAVLSQANQLPALALTLLGPGG